MSLPDTHKQSKTGRYWSNLTDGDTGTYKEAAIAHLLDAHFPAQCGAVLDIGCGTSDLARHHRARLKAPRLVMMDYDAAVVAKLRAAEADPTAEWQVGDIFDLGTSTDRFDLVFLLDMLHEVSSFKARVNPDGTGEIDLVRGAAVVAEALANIGAVVSPGGGVVITDNVFTDGNPQVTVRVRTPAALGAVRRFLDTYPSRRMAVTWIADDTLEIAARDFCILLTQYNKIKNGQEDRWIIEQHEIHQYFSLPEYVACFDALGFDVHAIVGTPDPARREWTEDFAVIDGLPGLPEKRITLLAIKRGAAAR